MRLFYCESKNSVQKIKIFKIFFVVCCTSCCKMEKRLENIKASTVFQVQWFANSENYNAAASGSSGKMAYVYQDGRKELESICSVLWPLHHVF